MYQYPSYKKSGVRWIGDIPQHWRVIRLKYSDTVIMGQSPKSADYIYEQSGLPFLQGNADFTKLHPIPRVWCDTASKISHVNDVLVSVRAPIGAVNIADQDYGIGRGLCAIRGNESDFKLLFYIFNAIKEELHSIGTGSTYTAVSANDVKNLYIPNIPLLEQRSIIDFLNHKTSQIDTLIDKKKRQIELLQEQRMALINNSVTKGLNPEVPMKDSGVEWLGEIPIHWQPRIKLTMLAQDARNTIANGPFGSNLLVSELIDAGIPVIYIRDIRNGIYKRISASYVTQVKAQELDYYRVDSGDLLIAKVGDPPGTAAIYPDDEPAGIVTQDVVRIKVKREKANPNYLVFLINSHTGQAIIEQITIESTRSRFPLGDFKNIRIPLPPIAEQTKIVEYLTTNLLSQDIAINKLQDLLTFLLEYREVLISEAVTGRIDVRNGWTHNEQ